MGWSAVADGGVVGGWRDGMSRLDTQVHGRRVEARIERLERYAEVCASWHTGSVCTYFLDGTLGETMFSLVFYPNIGFPTALQCL